MWNEIINRGKTGLDIKDGILIKAYPRDGVVDISREVKGVMDTAFDSNPEARINLSFDLVKSMTRTFRRELQMLMLNEKKQYAQFEKYSPMVAVWGCDTDAIRKAVRKAIVPDNVADEAVAKVQMVDINQVNEIYQQIRERNGEVVEFNGEKISSLRNLPLIARTPVQQFGSNFEYFNHLIKAYRRGILLVTNLNEDNYCDLPHNFIYNLIKHHSFCGVRISPQWLVVLQVGKNVKLDAPGGVPMVFDGNRFLGLSTQEYLKRMREEGKLVTIEEGSIAPDEEDASKKNTEANIEVKDMEIKQEATQKKEIDWEERHFQICLALLSNPNVYTAAASVSGIISRADKMVERLKGRLNMSKNNEV